MSMLTVTVNVTCCATCLHLHLSMQVLPGLYLCGEVLDVFGRIGRCTPLTRKHMVGSTSLTISHSQPLPLPRLGKGFPSNGSFNMALTPDIACIWHL